MSRCTAALEARFDQLLYGMLAIFLFAGTGNASTFKQMPMNFERRQARGGAAPGRGLRIPVDLRRCV